MKKEIAVVLSGCGVFDGSEINETVLTHIAIAEAGYPIQFYAPSGDQTSVVNHLTQENEQASRSIIEESWSVNSFVDSIYFNKLHLLAKKTASNYFYQYH